MRTNNLGKTNDEVYKSCLELILTAKLLCKVIGNDYIINIGEGNGSETMDITTDILVDVLSETDATTIFCCNDLMGVGAVNACKRLKLDIPKDISIVGFDNVFLSRIVEPRLTTVDQNMFRLGYSAATIISEGKQSGKFISLNNILVKRESTGPCNKNF